MSRIYTSNSSYSIETWDTDFNRYGGMDAQTDKTSGTCVVRGGGKTFIDENKLRRRRRVREVL